MASSYNSYLLLLLLSTTSDGRYCKYQISRPCSRLALFVLEGHLDDFVNTKRWVMYVWQPFQKNNFCTLGEQKLRVPGTYNQQAQESSVEKCWNGITQATDRTDTCAFVPVRPILTHPKKTDSRKTLVRAFR